MYINISSCLLYREGPALQKWNSKWHGSSIDISQKYIYLQNNFKQYFFALHIYALKLIGGPKGFACVGDC